MAAICQLVQRASMAVVLLHVLSGLANGGRIFQYGQQNTTSAKCEQTLATGSCCTQTIFGGDCVCCESGKYDLDLFRCPHTFRKCIMVVPLQPDGPFDSSKPLCYAEKEHLDYNFCQHGSFDPTAMVDHTKMPSARTVPSPVVGRYWSLASDNEDKAAASAHSMKDDLTRQLDLFYHPPQSLVDFISFVNDLLDKIEHLMNLVSTLKSLSETPPITTQKVEGLAMQCDELDTNMQIIAQSFSKKIIPNDAIADYFLLEPLSKLASLHVQVVLQHSILFMVLGRRDTSDAKLQKAHQLHLMYRDQMKTKQKRATAWRLSMVKANGGKLTEENFCRQSGFSKAIRNKNHYEQITYQWQDTFMLDQAYTFAETTTLEQRVTEVMQFTHVAQVDLRTCILSGNFLGNAQALNMLNMAKQYRADLREVHEAWYDSMLKLFDALGDKLRQPCTELVCSGKSAAHLFGWGGSHKLGGCNHIKNLATKDGTSLSGQTFKKAHPDMKGKAMNAYVADSSSWVCHETCKLSVSSDKNFAVVRLSNDDKCFVYRQGE